MSGVFVDTGAWFARFVPTDPDHPAAKGWLDRNTSPLITTDYIVDELLTLLKVRGEYQRALEVGPNTFVPRNEPGAMRNRFPLSHRCFNSAKLPDKSRWDSSPRTLRKRKCSTTEQPCNSGKAPPCAPISAGS